MRSRSRAVEEIGGRLGSPFAPGAPAPARRGAGCRRCARGPAFAARRAPAPGRGAARRCRRRAADGRAAGGARRALVARECARVSTKRPFEIPGADRPARGGPPARETSTSPRTARAAAAIPSSRPRSVRRASSSAAVRAASFPTAIIDGPCVGQGGLHAVRALVEPQLQLGADVLGDAGRAIGPADAALWAVGLPQLGAQLVQHRVAAPGGRGPGRLRDAPQVQLHVPGGPELERVEPGVGRGGGSRDVLVAPHPQHVLPHRLRAGPMRALGDLFEQLLIGVEAQEHDTEPLGDLVPACAGRRRRCPRGKGNPAARPRRPAGRCRRPRSTRGAGV